MAVGVTRWYAETPQCAGTQSGPDRCDCCGRTDVTVAWRRGARRLCDGCRDSAPAVEATP